jgi:hypothetical protein
MKLIILFSLFLSTEIFGQTGLQPIEKDPNTVDGRPIQTDKVLLRDGSEKQHVTKKPKGTPIPKATPLPVGAGLPTDVD